ncbi:glycosyl hydrolase family 28-related protein [Clostridium perfringens]
MNNLEQIVCQYYKDKNGNPMSYHIRRKHQISPKNYQIQLDGIPDEYRGIEVIEPVGLYRVYNADEIAEDSYWVRDDGNIFFHESRACQNVMLDYYSIGLPVVGAGRIYTLLDEEGNVIETLEDILKKGKTVVEALKTMNDVIVAIDELKTSTYEGVKVVNTLDHTIDKGYELLAKLNALDYIQRKEFDATIKTLNDGIKNFNTQVENVQSGLNSTNEKVEKNIDSLKEINKKIKNHGVVNIKDFGAVGDGINDDIEAINKAIQYCNENKITMIEIPNGIYYVTKSIATKGIELKGLSKPYIPFLDWGYTRPNSQLNDYNKYKEQCKGTIFTSDKDINIFEDGLTATNIGILGNRRALNQNGISQTRGGQTVTLNKCLIAGMGKYGIYAPYGLIAPNLKDTGIVQNGCNGIYIDKELGNYTGETNQIYIDNCWIERNESHGIYGNIMGRGMIIKNTFLEYNGEPSDPDREKSKDVIYGCYFNLYNSGGMGCGSINLEDNYSEETMGLFFINAVGTAHNISIKRNFWRPYNQKDYSCGMNFNGWIKNLTIQQNNFYTQHDYVLFQKSNNIKEVTIDMPYTGELAYEGGAMIETSESNDKTYCNIKSNNSKTIHNFDSGGITDSYYDSSSNLTYYYLNASRLDGNKFDNIDFGADGWYCYWTGYALKLGNNFVGIIRGWSASNKILQIHGNRSVNIGNGSFSIEKIGGFQTLNGNGQARKIVIDWDDSLFISPR